MNFVPKERSKEVIKELINNRNERKRKEIEEMERKLENSRNQKN